MGATFDKYAQRGAYHWASLSNNPWRHHCPTVARYQAVLKANPNWSGATVVDVGCGDGALAGCLVKAGAVVTGVEPEAAGRQLAQQEFARRGLPGRFVAQLAELADDSFDVAVCSDVIEHVEQPEQLLQEIRRVVKPGGMVVVTTPIRLTETPLDPHHVQEFFPGPFQSLMESHFAAVTCQHHIPLAGLMLYYWQPWFFLRRSLITRLCNVLNICFGINPVAKINAMERYHLLQLAIGTKPKR
ncbi:MAG: class I SAM-dependent methyltransferase [Magnetococcales bacterium]|nr:class I SAM-dependent methyltransferase [Magnetococcales bacterium]